MHRYCTWGERSLLKEDHKYLDINFRKVMEDILSQYNNESEPSERTLMETYNGLTGQYNFFVGDEKSNNLDQLMAQNFELVNILIRAIPMSFEFELDIIDEVLLDILYGAKEEENLFVEDQAELNRIMKDTIHNIKKPKMNYNFLFDPQIIQSTSQKVKIPVIGSGLVRLWLSSSKFRKLFVETTTRYEKYGAKEIYDILDEGEQRGIKYKLDDQIILEKLLGLSTGKMFIDFVIDALDEPEVCPWADLLSIILKFQGEYSRVAIIQAIGYDFYNWKNGARKNEDKRLVVYIKLLEKLVDTYNHIYQEAVFGVRELGHKIYKASEMKSVLLEKRSWIQQAASPVFQNDPRDSFRIEERQIQEFLTILSEKKTKQEKIQFIKHQRYMQTRITPFYLELDELSRRMWFRSDIVNEDTKITNQVRKIIIEKNKDKCDIH